MYRFYLGDLAFPVAPGKVIWKKEGQNEQFTLINQQQSSMIHPPALTEIQFEAILPGQKAPCYGTGVGEPFAMVALLEQMAQEKKPVDFQVVREALPYGRGLRITLMTVTLERFTVIEDAAEGFDLLVKVVLREYRQRATVQKNAPTQRPENKEKPDAYTVKAGDTLWGICRRIQNDGSLCYDVAQKNGITDPDRIYPGQVIYF